MFMATTEIAVLWDRLLEPVAQCFDEESARRLAELRFSSADEARVEELAERANEGLLTDDERREYEAFIQLDDLVSLLVLKANGS